MEADGGVAGVVALAAVAVGELHALALAFDALEAVAEDFGAEPGEREVVECLGFANGKAGAAGAIPGVAGGEVDVAVISKSEGMVWVRRKHYFPADLNARFFARHFGRET